MIMKSKLGLGKKIAHKVNLITVTYKWLRKYDYQPNSPENINDEITRDTDHEERNFKEKIAQEEIEEENAEPDIDEEEKILIVDENDDGSIVMN